MTAVAGQHRPVLLRRELSPEKQARIQQRLREGAQRREVSRQAIEKSGATEGPLSFGQQRFWFLDQLEPGHPVYHVPFGLRLSGKLDCAAVEHGVAEIVRRHEALRTVFELRNGAPVQVVRDAGDVPVPLRNLEQLRADHAGIREALIEEASRAFQLSEDFPIRATLFRVAAEEHILLFTVHHIAGDAWSVDLLVNEWCSLYSSRVGGNDAALAEVPIQYLDFARWQREQFEQGAFAKELEFWRQRLGNKPPAIDLPLDHARPAMPSNAGATRTILLDAATSSAIAQLAHRAGASKFMTLLAAFKILLHRYSDQDDIAVGSPMSRRTLNETEPLIGLFLNVAVMRSDLSGNPSFVDVLERVRQTTLDTFANQNVPFEKIVEELQPTRDLSRTPFFQVMFTLQEPGMPRRKLEGGVTAEAFELDLNVSPYDLTLLMQEKDGLLEATLEYKTDLFSAEAVDRILGHFRTLLEGIVANPEARVSDLPLLTNAERRQLLGFNPPPVEFPREKCVHTLVEEQVVRTPDATAVQFGSESLTYRELNDQADRVAAYLSRAGIGVETPVGICMERSIESIVSVLGVLKAGGAYVPIEPDEPTERLMFKLRDSGASMVLTQAWLLDSFPAELDQHGVRVVALDGEALARSHGNADAAPSRARPENLAYIIYTSGSTGTPKGVLVEHRALVNHSVGIAREFNLNASDRVLQFAPLSFDVSAEEIFPTLISGATLVLRPAELAISVKDFHPFSVREGLTIVNLPAPYWSEWIVTMEQQQLELPPSLRVVIAGSDTVTSEHYARWRRLAGDRVRWCNAYGTTEATITTTLYEPQPGELPNPVPIGRPTANTQVYILDRYQQLTPIGVAGEMFVGGEEVARGYLNRPEASASNFVADKFSRKAGARLNRTGDYGKWRADGNIEFLGRRDEQVKIRGFRIELGEVTAALLKHPAVRDAVVAVRNNARREKCLVAYAVGREQSPHFAGQLLEFLRERLPGYMVPAAVVPMAQLPRLSSGKVNMQALPAPDSHRPDLEAAFVAPSDPLEETLAKAWREVLGIDQVGVLDNFFDLGGHSLLAVRLFTEIEKLTGCNLPVLTLFQTPTIRGLAEALRRKQSTITRSSIVAVRKEGRKAPFFLVHGAGGGMLWGYANVAKYLDAERPVYAFNSRGMDGLEEFPTIEEMAAHYVEELRAVQPRGPYYLGGYCFGGLVAYEMAQQLVAARQRVGLLALMNSTPPNAPFEQVKVTPAWLARFARNSRRWFWDFLHWEPQQRRRFLSHKMKALRKRCFGNGQPTDEDEIEADDYVDLKVYPPERRRLWVTHLRAASRYRPQPYPGKVTILRTPLYPFLCSFDATFGWGELAGGNVTVKIVPGAHESILNEPYVRRVAAELDECFAKADLEREHAWRGTAPARAKDVSPAVPAPLPVNLA
jgi:amino acid adenylation domain-containing protein